MIADRTVVIITLAAIAIVSVVGIFVLLAEGKPVPSEAWVPAAGVVTGLLGFLSHPQSVKPE